MPDFPPRSIRLYLRDFIQLRANVGQRIVDPNSGHQYEILHDEVDFFCPICQFEQAAPAGEDIDYECPRCKWRYKVFGDMLVVWDQRTQGIERSANAPGTYPAPIAVDSGIDSTEVDKANFEKAKSTKDWAMGKNEEWGKKTQVQIKKDLDETK